MMCLRPRISRCARGNRSRRSLIAGSVRTKSPIAPPRMTRMRFRSVTRDGASEKSGTVEEKQTVGEAPPAVAARTPVDLIAHQIRHRDPKEADDDQDVSKHGHEQPAGFIPEKGRVEERFGPKQKQDAEGAGR